jgi:uncharacterized protein (TIGR02996 family)
MTTAVETGLLQAIMEGPEDDLPRRIYADWLDDHDQPRRAEFIRLQLDLARLGPCGHPWRQRECPSCSRRGREEGLLSAHGVEWLATDLPGQSWELSYSSTWLPVPNRSPRQRLAAFHRGFIGVLFLPIEDFLRTAKKLSEAPPPLHAVQLLDRKPLASVDGYGWSTGYGENSGDYYLPVPLWEHLPTPPGGRPKLFGWASEAEAIHALSRACVEYGRSLARRGESSPVEGQFAHRRADRG